VVKELICRTLQRAPFDVVIVAAGIVGCSSAYRLARRGMWVAVLDKDGIGMAATGQSSAIVR
jgi:glycine/D-amino acid oxidase-like deaminating enzyme